MSHSPPSYIDGVPVKIAEKYKPPPIGCLPSNITQLLNTDEIPTIHIEYDFSLENSVTTKIKQWRKVREEQAEARKERMRIAEAERLEKQKQLLTAVSYPSTDDLSSDDEDDGSSPSEKNATSSNTSQKQQRFDTILTPTVVPDTSNQAICNHQLKGNFSKINYSDFENDTSSPFDSVELKTINDLDVLAQVLNVTQIHSLKDVSITNHTANEFAQNANASENCCDINNYESTSSITTPNYSQNPNNYNAVCNNQQIMLSQYENRNGSLKANEMYYFNQMGVNQNYNNFTYNSNMAPDHTKYNIQTHNPYANIQNHFFNQGVFNSYAAIPSLQNANGLQSETLQVKNKSKSVPDILKELNADIRDSEIRRKRNDSQSECHAEKEEEQINANGMKIPNKDEIFLKLSPSSQNLAKNISSMGFPLDRVSRIADKLGNDDKKIVEHLIPLSELLDFGFEESRISEALLKFDNNKEKALDFLIS